MQDHNTWLHPLSNGVLWLKMSAMVRVKVRGEEDVIVRALIDPNAARSSIMKREAQRLRCEVVRNRTTLTLAHRATPGWQVEVQCAVEDRDYGFNIVAPIYLAHTEIRVAVDQEADPNYTHRRRWIIILGADVASRLFVGPSVGRPGRMLRQNTKFGAVYFGVAELVREDDL